MAVKKLTTISRYTGTKFDTKPTSCPVGSTFREYDTRIMYETPDGGTTWKIKSIGSSNEDWLFGEPTLISQGNGDSVWARGANILSTHQKGSTGWTALLYGGIQSAWDDAASMYIPVNEMPLIDLEVGTTMWSWFQTATQIAGVGMVIWVHDPDDFDKRAEISMLTEVGHVELSAGWNAHELAVGNDCVWYGENTGTHDTTVTAGSPYNFSQFLTDDVFSTYTIYRISFAYGFQTGNSAFNNTYLADVKINGIVIPLKPDSSGTGRIGHRYVEHTNDVVALTIAPKTPFRLNSIDIHLSAALATGELVTITKDSGYGTGGYGDTVLFSEDLYIGTRLSYHGVFGEDYDFGAADELDIALSANSLNRNIGIDITYQTVFS